MAGSLCSADYPVCVLIVVSHRLALLPVLEEAPHETVGFFEVNDGVGAWSGVAGL